MIITKKKDLDSILNYLRGFERILLLGCGACAEQCRTGGRQELEEMAELLKKAGKDIVASTIVDETCYTLLLKKEFRKYTDLLKDTEAILVLSCGAGVRATLEAIPGKPIFPALDTLFLANVQRVGQFIEGCSLCGKCYLGETGGICPITCCPKGLLNGPCGGVVDGMCEMNLDMPCAWVEIYKRLKSQGRLDQMKKIKPPRDYSNTIKPRKVTVRQK
ncbi:MAG: methylenetetrahydrofolate reductase C-terminal domain-containing protein [Thermodesulfobacteriota bacterium]